MSNARGKYRAVFTVMFETKEFLSLSADARLVLLTLRLCPQNNIASIYRLYEPILAELAGLSPARVKSALDTLCNTPIDSPWIVYREGIVWVRNGLRFEPGFSLNNPKQRKAVENVLIGLPKCSIVKEFCDYYGLDTLSNTLFDSLSDSPSTGTRSPDPEPDPEPEPDPRRGAPDGAAPPSLFPGPANPPPKKSRTPPEVTRAAAEVYDHCALSDAFEVPNAETASGQKVKHRTLNSIIDRLTEEARAARTKNPDLTEDQALGLTVDRFKAAADGYIAEYRRRRQGRPDAWRYKLANFWGQKAHWTYHDPEAPRARASPDHENFPVGEGAVEMG